MRDRLSDLAPDLDTQRESLLDCVWRCESWERQLDRIMFAGQVEAARERLAALRALPALRQSEAR